MVWKISSFEKTVFTFGVWIFLSSVCVFPLTSHAAPAPGRIDQERNLLNDLAEKKIYSGFAGELHLLETRDPELYQTMLNEQAALHPKAYEAYRRFMAATAPDLPTFLNWATPEELADDLVDKNGQPVNWDQDSLLQNTNYEDGMEITVHRLSERMDVVGGGLYIQGIRVATGRAGHLTPSTCHTAIGLSKDYYSRKYKAAMPYSVFFLPGIALHAGSTVIKSHGCVHLPYRAAESIYDAAERLGPSNVRVCVVNN